MYSVIISSNRTLSNSYTGCEGMGFEITSNLRTALSEKEDEYFYISFKFHIQVRVLSSLLPGILRAG